jgi:hypothetical protein
MHRKNRPAASLLAAVLLVAGGSCARSLANTDEGATRTQAVMEEVWGAMVEAGEWRTRNPDFSDARTTPEEFALRWRWGPHRQHVVGELLGVFDTAEGEKTALYWSLYAWHNPVTGEVTALQIGWDGSMAVGPMRRADDGRILVDQILYGSDGTSKALRHEEVLHPDGDAYDSNVYEQDDAGEWELKRRWVWRRASQD